MSLGVLRDHAASLLARASDMRVRQYLLASVPRLKFDRQAAAYRRYLQFAPLGDEYLGHYSVLWGQWIGDEHGGHGVSAPDQFDARSMGDLKWALSFIEKWLVDRADWGEAASRGDMTKAPPVIVPSGTLVLTAKALSPEATVQVVTSHARKGRAAAFTLDGAAEATVSVNYGVPESHWIASCSSTERFALHVTENQLYLGVLSSGVRTIATLPFTQGNYVVHVGGQTTPHRQLHLVLEGVDEFKSEDRSAFPRIRFAKPEKRH